MRYLDIWYQRSSEKCQVLATKCNGWERRIDDVDGFDLDRGRLGRWSNRALVGVAAGFELGKAVLTCLGDERLDNPEPR